MLFAIERNFNSGLWFLYRIRPWLGEQYLSGGHETREEAEMVLRRYINPTKIYYDGNGEMIGGGAAP